MEVNQSREDTRACLPPFCLSLTNIARSDPEKPALIFSMHKRRNGSVHYRKSNDSLCQIASASGLLFLLSLSQWRRRWRRHLTRAPRASLFLFPSRNSFAVAIFIETNTFSATHSLALARGLRPSTRPQLLSFGLSYTVRWRRLFFISRAPRASVFPRRAPREA